ncbi:hypothetical protein HYV50_03825 [Candidatus Pacearchaeota archaeon]|nr:hypothetical protein [Candidatus Pacearchaeota archaeon]
MDNGFYRIEITFNDQTLESKIENILTSKLIIKDHLNRFYGSLSAGIELEDGNRRLILTISSEERANRAYEELSKEQRFSVKKFYQQSSTNLLT